MPLLVLDEQLERPQLAQSLRDRGLDVRTVADYGASGQLDPDVVRKIDQNESSHWILVTMDLTIVEDHPGFDWSRYTIAWIRVHEDLSGAAFERAKVDVLQHHARAISRLARGEQHSFDENRHFKSPPSLAYMTRKR